jgi:hypothetical protein
MTKIKYEFSIASDLKKFGITEDGEDYIGDVYYLEHFHFVCKAYPAARR